MLLQGCGLLVYSDHFQVVDEHLLKLHVAAVEVNSEFDVVLEKVVEVTASPMPIVFAHQWFLEPRVVGKFKRQVNDLEGLLASKIYQKEPLSC